MPFSDNKKTRKDRGYVCSLCRMFKPIPSDIFYLLQRSPIRGARKGHVVTRLNLSVWPCLPILAVKQKILKFSESAGEQLCQPNGPAEVRCEFLARFLG